VEEMWLNMKMQLIKWKIVPAESRQIKKEKRIGSSTKKKNSIS
jgi:hypothetical protein